MNKSESKYYNTAVKMDEAFLKLLEEKDFKFITIKEICLASGVNRSTFYLHYETVNDLLLETAEYINGKFYSYFEHLDMNYNSILNAPKDDLIFITPEFLTPWLSFVKENKLIYNAVLKKFDTLKMGDGLFTAVCDAINVVYDKFDIPEKSRKYMMKFYLEGMNAIIKEWIKDNCEDSIEELIQVIEECVRAK